MTSGTEMRVKVGRKWRDMGPGVGQLTPGRARLDIDDQLATRIPPDLIRGDVTTTMTVSIEVRYGQS